MGGCGWRAWNLQLALSAVAWLGALSPKVGIPDQVQRERLRARNKKQEVNDITPPCCIFVVKSIPGRCTTLHGR